MAYTQNKHTCVTWKRLFVVYIKLLIFLNHLDATYTENHDTYLFCSQKLMYDQMASQGEIVSRNIGVVITTADIERICDRQFFGFDVPLPFSDTPCLLYADTKKGNIDIHTCTKRL